MVVGGKKKLFRGKKNIRVCGQRAEREQREQRERLRPTYPELVLEKGFSLLTNLLVFSFTEIEKLRN